MPPHWDYPTALAWLYDRQKVGIKLGLDKVRKLLEALGNPQESFQSIHVAGTNGKGSVVRYLSEALQRAGFQVGDTTSPHLIRFTERIRINGTPIDEADVAQGLALIRPIVEQLDAQDEPPTFFEIVTALAFQHFRDAGVAWAVVETGMGGRLDATNVLWPQLTVITNVGLDHTEFLGAETTVVALEKAGIMKTGIPCITGASGQALHVLKAVSLEHQVPMSILGEDYHVRPDVNGMRLLRPGGEAHFDIGMAGEHQLDNAALAVAAVDALRLQGVDVPDRALHDALAHARVPGRLESFEQPARQIDNNAPWDTEVQILVDGAHNEAAAHALRRHLAHLDWHSFHLITGFARDKDWNTILDQWAPLAAQVWGVPIRSPRTLDPHILAPAVTGIGIPFSTAPNAESAIRAAVRTGATRIVVAGSLFLAGETRAFLRGESLEEIGGNQ